MGMEGKSIAKPREIQQRPARIEVRLALCIMVGALIRNTTRASVEVSPH